MKPMKNVDVRSTFLVCFFFQLFFGGIKTILPKWGGRKKKNEETTDKNAGHLGVFCFRISRQLVSHLAMTKRKRNCVVFNSRYSEYSTYTKGGAATRKFLPQSCRERTKKKESLHHHIGMAIKRMELQ
jgi:hypothetical protein